MKYVKAPDIFPDLAGSRWVVANLAEKIGVDHSARKNNPCLQPRVMDQFVANLHKVLDTDYSFGGYGEDRGQLWQGSYLKPDEAVHCGIDLNVPAGAKVILAHEAKILKVMHDREKHGWGTAISCQLVRPLGQIAGFIVAHLADDTFVRAGEALLPGAPVGVVGRYSENGGWYEHLHVQAFTDYGLRRHKGDIFSRQFDGYDKKESVAICFPDPTPLLYKDSPAPR